MLAHRFDRQTEARSERGQTSKSRNVEKSRSKNAETGESGTGDGRSGTEITASPAVPGPGNPPGDAECRDAGRRHGSTGAEVGVLEIKMDALMDFAGGIPTCDATGRLQQFDGLLAGLRRAISITCAGHGVHCPASAPPVEQWRFVGFECAGWTGGDRASPGVLPAQIPRTPSESRRTLRVAGGHPEPPRILATPQAFVFRGSVGRSLKCGSLTSAILYDIFWWNRSPWEVVAGVVNPTGLAAERP